MTAATAHRALKTSAIALGALLLGACSSGAASTVGTDDTGESTTAPAPSEADAPAARLDANVAHGSQVALGRRVKVRVHDGELDEVTLTAPDGSTVDAAVRNGVWRTREPLRPRTRYTLAASATSADGAVTERDWRFRTPRPEETDFPAVTPLEGATVGVGHPVVIYLEHDVDDTEAFEERLEITSSRPVTGSWGWLDARTVAYRPKRFWPEHTDVTVTLDTAKTHLSGDAWVMEDRTISFEVGRRQVLRIDDATHSLDVERSDGVVRTMGVSMGKPGFTTRSGVKVIMSQEVSRRMDSATVGIGGSEAYDLDVPYAMRITATGEFIHGAPWSEWAQGSQNVSHGCTNVSLADAIWLYENTLIGDPVITRGTGRATEEWNGLGGLWNYSWQEWEQR